MVVAALLSAGTLAAACSSSTSSPSSSTTTTIFPPTEKVQKPATPITAETVVINAKTVTVPREEYAPHVPIPSGYSSGQQVILASDGVLPRLLNTPETPTITWTNLTAKPVRLLILVAGTPQPIQTIAAGSSYSKFFNTTGSLDVTYETSTRFTGQISIGGMPLAPIPTTTTTTTP
jgi:hypothetical protein